MPNGRLHCAPRSRRWVHVSQTLAISLFFCARRSVATPTPAPTALPTVSPTTTTTASPAAPPYDSRTCAGNLTQFYRAVGGPASELCEPAYFVAEIDIATVCTTPFTFTDPADGNVTVRRGFTVRSGGGCTALTESDCWWLVEHIGEYKHPEPLGLSGLGI
jgi:hypothetical protein